MADRRLTRSNFLPSGLSVVTSNISSNSVDRAEVAVAMIILFVLNKKSLEMDAKIILIHYLSTSRFLAALYHTAPV